MLGQKDSSEISIYDAHIYARVIPRDHILRRINGKVDFSWVREEVKNLYCEDNGRPSVDPEVAMRLMIAGVTRGIVLDRELMAEAQVNLAFRWFIGYGIDEELPDHSSLTRIRQRWGPEVFLKLFLRVLDECRKAGLVDGRKVHVDSTLIRADVSWESMAKRIVEENKVEEEKKPEQASDSVSRKTKKGKKRDGKTKRPKEKKYSRTDPDATLSTMKSTERMEPCFKQHTAVDSKAGVIVDVFITTGEESEGRQLMAQVDRIEDNTGVQIETLTADSGYAHTANYSALESRKIDAIIPPQRQGGRRVRVPSSRFRRDRLNNRVRCPGKKFLMPNRYSEERGGWWYRSEPSDCAKCRLQAECLPAKKRSRGIFLLDGYESLVRARRRRLRGDPEDKRLYMRHRGLIEGVHGEAKEQHGLRRAARRGTPNVSIQSFLTAAAINMKRLVREIAPVSAVLSRLIRPGNPLRLATRFRIELPFRFLTSPKISAFLPQCVHASVRFPA